MSDPTQLVETHGTEVTYSRVVDYTIGASGDVEDVVREYEHTKGIISSPSETDSQELEGRLDSGGITVTVPSGLDVEMNRTGGKDRVVIGHVDPATATDVEAYTVQDVSDDTHNFAGIRKVTLTCDRYSGRDNVQGDASEYYELWTESALTVASGESYTVTAGEQERYSGVENDGQITNDGTLRNG